MPCKITIMGKLNVTMLRYLTREDFRVLTAVSAKMLTVQYTVNPFGKQ